MSTLVERNPVSAVLERIIVSANVSGNAAFADVGGNPVSDDVRRINFRGAPCLHCRLESADHFTLKPTYIRPAIVQPLLS